MKSISLCILSFILAFAILAPSIITLVGASNDKILVMDFTEEENKKEEKKEISEKDFFFFRDFISPSSNYNEKSTVSSIYFEGDYSHSIDIFLPPPEYIF
ncbi:MAG: hypothetical protein WBM77_08275 [Maribacter sp.]